MTEPEPEFYCGACRRLMSVEYIPTHSASGETQWVLGRVYCLTPDCPSDQGVVDRDGNPVDV